MCQVLLCQIILYTLYFLKVQKSYPLRQLCSDSSDLTPPLTPPPELLHAPGSAYIF